MRTASEDRVAGYSRTAVPTAALEDRLRRNRRLTKPSAQSRFLVCPCRGPREL